MKTLLLPVLLAAAAAAQAQTAPPEGLWQGFDGEWRHVSRQLLALAEAFPAAKFDWRPAPGVRSTGEILIHIAEANYGLLGYTSPQIPIDPKAAGMGKTAKSKAEIIGFLKNSLEAVKTNHAGITPSGLQRAVRIMNRDTTADAIYLRIIVHANEHMGQLIAYARTAGVAPPWAEK